MASELNIKTTKQRKIECRSSFGICPGLIATLDGNDK
jgi:hypothetical protein